ncbi:penicillin acylase family protein [Rugosimonospora acidiphila]|uniref:Penicillin acylase family protein n=1 Tax=Rugosimonospora acidiphila TaxID=556531 RepID=A0ABP9RM72_9ACTN
MRTPSRSSPLRRLLALGSVGVLAAVLAVPSGAAAAPAGPHVVRQHIKGLDHPVSIDIDTWGVPHIFAGSVDDAFFAQGFNAARDRLFQIDLWHRRGLGELSEAFGPSYVDQDRAARLFLYRGDMNAEWAAYGSDAKQIATQFTDGINAYIKWLKKNPSALPPEFRMFDYWPDTWRPEDVVRIRTHALVSGLSEEVARARLVCAGGLDLDPLRTKLQPDHATEVPQGLDPCLPDDVLNVYNLATESVSFTGDAAHPVALVDSGSDADDGTPIGGKEGSNNWTISGSRTATGRPILANDPHRTQQAPSLRYISQISAPGMDVIGAGEPALPGISIGHNESIAFGLTVFGIDAQDLYVYDLDASNTRYRYQGRWERMQTERTPIQVRDGSTQVKTLQYTRHGPVIYIDAAKHKAYAVRSTWSEPGTSAYFASISYMRAQNWQQFLDAMGRWGAPGENQVYADVKGNIGWKPGGLAPRRSGYDGLLPVPGDGRYEWNGFVPSSKLPQVFNPAQGYFASANQYNLPAGTPPANVTSYEWSGPDRYQRIVNVLAANSRQTLQDSAQLQNDSTSPRAQELVGMLSRLPAHDPAVAFLRNWNGSEALGSTQATLYQRYWESRINTAVRDALVPPQRRSLINSVDWLVVMDVLRHPTDWLGAHGVAARDQILLSSLQAAYAAATKDLGPDTSGWGYTGNARTMPHPMAKIDPSLSVGPFPIPGSSTTPIAGGNASYRQVIDVGKWDQSLAINTPGQAGNPNSPHYRDLASMWSKGQYFPLLYSRAAVEAHTETQIQLLPG